MKIKKLSKYLWFVAVVFVIFIGIIIILFSSFSLPIQKLDAKSITSTVVETVINSPAKTTAPMLLKIPSLKIDTVLEQVNLTPEGAVGVPKSITKAAWFNLSAKPGLVGNTVVVGHFGWKLGVPAIFNNLAKLQKGDKIYMTDGAGNFTTFIVKKLQKYNKDSEVPAIFTSSDGKAHLNLITCDGTWNQTTKSYSERLVIFTDKE